MKPQPIAVTPRKRVYADADFKKSWGRDGYGDGLSDCPYGVPGDRIWVKETVSESEPCYLGGKPQPTVWYRADNNRPTWAERKWTPSILCPRRLSRILLELTDVRVERLQAISEADARAEGVRGWDEASTTETPDDYRLLWESINGPGSWAANPWVWALTFRRLTP